ncbi:MAG: M48 family metalloprotease [Oceanospirillaceae bacterium]|nr:M48 family metalloprotease [Oceanospirillaceae bacterium]
MGRRHARYGCHWLLSLSLLGCAAPAPLPDKPSTEAIERETLSQQQQALALRHAREFRLARVSVPLLHAALPLCPGHTRSWFGLSFHYRDRYPPQWREAAKTLYSLDEHARLRAPLPDSPAARAGLRTGDRITRIQGRDLDSEQLRLEQVEQLLRDQPGPVRVEWLRDGESNSAELTPLELCDWPVELSSGGPVNAFAYGNRVRITETMLRYAGSDDELALVVAHELAHNGLDHIDKQLRNLLLGALLDFAATLNGIPSPGLAATLGVRHGSVDWELEADFAALSLLQAAGYPIDRAPEFWRRLGTDFPQAIRHSRGTHPSTAERYLRMKADVERLQTAGDSG